MADFRLRSPVVITNRDIMSAWRRFRVPSIQLSRSRDWAQRIGRARDLSARYPAAAELLIFYQRVAGFQKALSDQLVEREQPKPRVGVSLRESIDIESVVSHLPALLEIVDQCGTAILKEAAAKLKDTSGPELLLLFDRIRRDRETDATLDHFFTRACIQPYAEFMSSRFELKPGFAGDKCPRCNSNPLLAVLRPEGNGGKRFLLCSFCMTEWEFRRVLCPTCGEIDCQKLPRFAADDLSWVRVEACDTCHFYLKSIDMTVEGLAVPIVDEIATAPLDLWATGQGYKKTQRNLLGF